MTKKPRPREKTLDLVFRDIPERNVAAFAEGVQATLDKLNLVCEYDETTPPDRRGGMCIYRAMDVHPV